MQSMELPLVLFTILSQTAIGMVFMSAVRAMAGPHEEQTRNEWLLIIVLMGLGLMASLFHLGLPLEAYRALAHLKKAWLSREVLAAGTFMALICAIFLALVTGAGISKSVKKALLCGAVLVGLVTLWASGMTYAPPSMPAINNALPLVFFLISATILGPAFASWFAGLQSQPLLARICTTALVTGLVMRLAAPCAWLSGGEIMRLSGLYWFASPLYWINILVMLICLATLWKNRAIPAWLPVLALVGELAGRATFFANTVHTAVNMGNLY